MTPAHVAEALERSRSDDAHVRCRSIVALVGSHDPVAFERVVELLADEAGGSVWDDDIVAVADIAQRELAEVVDRAWPALVAAFPTVILPVAVRIVALLRAIPPRVRLAMPVSAHDAIASRAELVPYYVRDAIAFEHALAKRFHAGELTEENAWQLWLRDHPSERTAALAALAACGDPSRVARQLVELLDTPFGSSAAVVLPALLHALDDQWLDAVIDSDWPRQFPDLLPSLARYGERAAVLVEICVAICNAPASATPGLARLQRQSAIEALRIFGPLARSALDRIEDAELVAALP